MVGAGVHERLVLDGLGGPVMHPEQLKALRAMSPARKLEVAAELYWAARRLTEAAVRRQHPEWEEPRVSEEVRRRFAHARD